MKNKVSITTPTWYAEITSCYVSGHFVIVKYNCFFNNKIILYLQ